MKKEVLLLAVSCKTGGLCPGGIDLSDPKKWIRIVKDDGCSGAVQGVDIDFAKPLDVIVFDGHPVPQGKQKENWVIDNNSCRKTYTCDRDILDKVYKQYGYHGFWGNFKSYLNEEEFEKINQPSESILKVTNVRIYLNDYNKSKIDFRCNSVPFLLRGISMTDQDFYDKISDGESICFENAYIVVSIPKDVGDWVHPETGEKRAYKFVSRVYEI